MALALAAPVDESLLLEMVLLLSAAEFHIQNALISKSHYMVSLLIKEANHRQIMPKTGLEVRKTLLTPVFT